MPFVTRNTLVVLAGLSAAAVVAAGAFVWSGTYNMGADDPHMRVTHRVLETMRKRSIATRAGELQVPELKDPARIRQGAGNYNAMCMGCHLAPGMAGTELSRGLYPAPPNLTRTTVDAAEAFWVIKHGIKASGMPAWGRSMGDDYIWNMAAFLQVLPTLSPAEYQAMVAASGGHEHGGGETRPHDHPQGAPADHHDAANGEAAGKLPAAEEGVEHGHADGTVERHPAPASVAAAAAQAPARADNAFPRMVVHKNASCGCCALWIEHVREAGLQVEVRDVDNLDPVKTRLGIPFGKGSCHTAEVGGYFVEGHVPAADIKRLLAQKPAAKGLVLPGMPAGSPGMERPDGTSQPYTVELVARDGSVAPYAQH